MKNLSIVILVGLLLPTACGVPVGQRLLTVQIELDGVITFEGIRGVPDNMPVEQMWSVLKDVSFQLTNKAAVSNSADTQTCSLNGKVVVRIQHVDRNLGRAALTSLSLRKGEPGSSWSLEQNEVDRIKRARTQ